MVLLLHPCGPGKLLFIYMYLCRVPFDFSGFTLPLAQAELGALLCSRQIVQQFCTSNVCFSGWFPQLDGGTLEGRTVFWLSLNLSELRLLLATCGCPVNAHCMVMKDAQGRAQPHVLG